MYYIHDKFKPPYEIELEIFAAWYFFGGKD